MSYHSHSTWEYGQPITDELIDEIIEVMNNNHFHIFAICSRVDQFAYSFANKSFDIETSLANSDESIRDQVREIYNKVQLKLKKEI